MKTYKVKNSDSTLIDTHVSNIGERLKDFSVIRGHNEINTLQISESKKSLLKLYETLCNIEGYNNPIKNK